MLGFRVKYNTRHARRPVRTSSEFVANARRCLQTVLCEEPFKVLFLGRDEFSCLVLEQLHKAKDVWQELEIVTQPDEKVGRRGSQLSVSPLKVLGQELDLSIHTIPHKRTDFKHWQVSTLSQDWLLTYQPPAPFLNPHPSHLIVTASFGRILPKSLLGLFCPSRRLNVHPSLLPLYRGAAPIQHTLMDGRRETGVCVIEMMEKSKGIDAGEIWGRREMSVPEDATFSSLRDTLARQGGDLLVSVLRDMLSGTAVARPQPLLTSDSGIPRAPMITLEDAIVDFTTMTAQGVKPLTTYLPNSKTLQLHALSIHPPPQVPSTLPSEAGAAIYDSHSRSILIRCAGDTVLSTGKVKQQDRVMLDAKEWWNGWKSFCGGEWRGYVVFQRGP
ncbi:Formyltransferase [Gloeophyllum trabeum ATCC 11539]|uniref:methionyl-tRNA formyltransferase n=1 Tax=Gloeophyllum trabeum (strain ATCC 11539 / FP-39264 / Madison 617) TaxID=670483 RepID=S7RD16_GLOTA|nr:Formyltransferase [Gloeophyllum trabeum ATCC 11539]EPQ52095.1 Formyltransferase [Gloeophyllum trabeum ATCC 11539]